MKTPEEIKHTLRYCWCKDEKYQCIKCPYNKENDSCDKALDADALAYIQQLEDHICDLTKMVPRWISVKERLPEKGALIVALCRYDFAPDKYYLLQERYDARSNFWRDGSAQYWTQLPEPPEEERHD